MSKLLNRETILKASDIETEDVEVPEWGGTVRVTGLTGTEKGNYEATLMTTKGIDIQMNLKNATVKLVALSIVDEEGKRIFTAADIETLGSKSSKALNKVYTVASRLSGLSKEDMKELTENLNETPSDFFTSN